MPRKATKPEVWAAFMFGLVALGVLLAIAIIVPENGNNGLLLTVSRPILAIACAGIAAVLPGFLEIEGRAAVAVRAGGALAVFVLVYVYNPSQVIEEQKREVAEEQKLDPPPVADYMVAVDEWLARMDSGEYTLAHQSASRDTKTRYPLAAFADIFRSYLEPLGRVIDRRLLGAHASEKTPTGERGHFRVVFYETAFENGEKRTEQIVVKAEDDMWKVTEHSFFPVAP